MKVLSELVRDGPTLASLFSDEISLIDSDLWHKVKLAQGQTDNKPYDQTATIEELEAYYSQKMEEIQHFAETLEQRKQQTERKDENEKKDIITSHLNNLQFLSESMSHISEDFHKQFELEVEPWLDDVKPYKETKGLTHSIKTLHDRFAEFRELISSCKNISLISSNQEEREEALLKSKNSLARVNSITQEVAQIMT